MRRLLSLANKDLIILLRDPASLFWVIGFPLIMALLFGSVYSGMGSGGGARAMKIAVVDADSTDYSQAFVQKLTEMSALTVYSYPLDSAEHRVRQGKLTAYVLLKDGFGAQWGIFGDESAFEIGIDPARRMEAGYLQGMLTQAVFQLMHEQLMSPKVVEEKLDALVADETVWRGLSPEMKDLAHGGISQLSEFAAGLAKIEKTPSDTGSTNKNSGGGMAIAQPKIKAVTGERIGPRSAFEITFPSSIMWALIAVAGTFGVSIVKERNFGTFLRLRLAPITRGHIIAGKGLAAFTACVVSCILLLIIAKLFFGVRLTRPVELLLAVAAAGYCFTGITMMVSVMGKTEESVSGAAWGIMLIMAMVGGAMMPLFIMPDWLLAISNVSPVKWSIIAVEGAIWREFTWNDYLLPFGMLLGIGTIALGIGVSVLSRSDS